MKIEEIYEVLRESALKSVVNITDWTKVILYVERQDKSVGFESAYINVQQEQIPVDTEADYFTSKAVKELFKYTSDHPNEFSKWNKVECTVSKDGEFNLDYRWDQSWQDEIDSLDREIS